MLRKYKPDPSHVVETTEVQIVDQVSYKEGSIQTLGRRETQLLDKDIPLVKQIRNHYYGVLEILRLKDMSP